MKKIVLMFVLVCATHVSAQLYDAPGGGAKEDIYSVKANPEIENTQVAPQADVRFAEKPGDIPNSVPVADGMLWIGMVALIAEFVRRRRLSR